MPFVQRDQAGDIIGCFALEQSYATEFVDDSDASLVAYVADAAGTSLLACANRKQASIAQGGFTVNANASGSPPAISVSTDVAHIGYLSSAVQLAQMMLAGTIPASSINWVQSSGAVPLTPAQIITVGVSVAALVQQSFTVLGEVIAAINAGTITAVDQVDNPPSPIPPWPVNS